MVNTFLSRLLQQIRGDKVGAVLARGASIALIMKAASIALSFTWLALLARLAGPRIYGQYIYVLNWLEVLALVGQMGLNIAALRFISSYQARGEWGLLRGFVNRSWQVALSASLLISVVSATIVWYIGDTLETGLIDVFWVGFVLLPLMVLVQLFSAHLQGLKRVAVSQAPLVLRPLALILFIILLIYFLGIKPATIAIFGLEIAVSAVLLIALWRVLVKGWSEVTAQQTAEYQTQEWLRVTLPLWLISLSSLILGRTDTIMIGMFEGTTQAGFYSAASRVASFVPFILTAANIIAAPIISQLYSQGQLAELQRTISRVTRGVFIFTIPIVLVILAFGKIILTFFGEGFVASYPALILLVAGQTFNALAGSVGYLMTMTEHQKVTAGVMLGTSMLNIVLNYLLIPTLGFIGAAVATMLSTICWNIILIIIAQRRLGINPSVFSLLSKHSG